MNFSGCINFREGLNPGNLVTNDHYIARYFEDIKLFWKSGAQLHVAIIDPPELVDPNGRWLILTTSLHEPPIDDAMFRNQILSTVKDFENTPYTMGREATVFFLLEYFNYLDQLNVEIENTDKLWNQKLKSAERQKPFNVYEFRSWLKFTGGSTQWQNDIVFNETTGDIKIFRFQVGK